MVWLTLYTVCLFQIFVGHHLFLKTSFVYLHYDMLLHHTGVNKQRNTTVHAHTQTLLSHIFSIKLVFAAQYDCVYFYPFTMATT